MDSHALFLQQAIDESRLSVEGGASPFGAIIVKDGQVVTCAHNSVVESHDATAHAEINAIRQASQKMGTHDLTGCILYCSCEPCPMCLEAIQWANIKEVYYAATRDDADSIGFRDKQFYDGDFVNLHRIQMPEAIEIMQRWYQSEDKQTY